MDERKRLDYMQASMHSLDKHRGKGPNRVPYISGTERK